MPSLVGSEMCIRDRFPADRGSHADGTGVIATEPRQSDGDGLPGQSAEHLPPPPQVQEAQEEEEGRLGFGLRVGLGNGILLRAKARTTKR